MDPELVRVWIRVIRDVIIYSLATSAVLVQLYRNLRTGEPPNLAWLGFAAFLFGLVPAFRLDEWIFKGNGGNRRGSNG